MILLIRLFGWSKVLCREVVGKISGKLCEAYIRQISEENEE